MPPTLAAARNTACGRLPANHRVTATWSRKSTSLRPAVSSSTFSGASLRTSAAPTMPRCPATKTVLPFSSNGVLAISGLPPGDVEIARHHLLDQLRERRFRLPAELLTRLRGVADQLIDFGRTKIDRVDTHDGLAGFLVDTGFVDARAAPFDGASDLGKGELD